MPVLYCQGCDHCVEFIQQELRAVAAFRLSPNSTCRFITIAVECLLVFTHGVLSSAPVKPLDNHLRTVPSSNDPPPSSLQLQSLKVESAGSDFIVYSARRQILSDPDNTQEFRWCGHDLGDVRVIRTMLRRLNVPSDAVNSIIIQAEYYYAARQY